MPVARLLCEGSGGSADARLLAQLLRGLPCEVVPSGAKQRLPDLVRAARSARIACCALADRDFPRDPDAWSALDEARDWESQGEKLGWQWQRKEVENYLYDAAILTRVFGWSAQQSEAYSGHLHEAWSSLGCATAGRITLTIAVPRFARLETTVEPGAGERDVEATLRRRMDDFVAANHIDVDAALVTWRGLLPRCRAGGDLFGQACSLFAGKDLRAVLAGKRGLQDLGVELKRPKALEERVLTALAEDDAPHTWLPEWKSLRDAIEAWEPGVTS